MGHETEALPSLIACHELLHTTNSPHLTSLVPSRRATFLTRFPLFTLVHIQPTVRSLHGLAPIWSHFAHFASKFDSLFSASTDQCSTPMNQSTQTIHTNLVRNFGKSRDRQPSLPYSKTKLHANFVGTLRSYLKIECKIKTCFYSHCKS